MPRRSPVLLIQAANVEMSITLIKHIAQVSLSYKTHAVHHLQSSPVVCMIMRAFLQEPSGYLHYAAGMQKIMATSQSPGDAQHRVIAWGAQGWVDDRVS